jgi:hypothetical protein
MIVWARNFLNKRWANYRIYCINYLLTVLTEFKLRIKHCQKLSKTKFKMLVRQTNKKFQIIEQTEFVRESHD